MLIKKHNNTQRETCAYSTALGCKALNCFVCASRTCSFYKTPQKELSDIKKANKRIASLSESEQAEIADKYYYSFMPWKEKE
jgi:hypothetical protein